MKTGSNFATSKITDFITELQSGAPTPGGGAVAALDSALGVALIMMVANHTIGKKKYEACEELNKCAVAMCESLLEELIIGIDKDAEAFEAVSAAYSMSRETDEEKQARSDAIATASIEAAKAPLKVMIASVDALKICNNLIGNSNTNLVSDLYVATLNLQSGLMSARYNVFANLNAISKKDETLSLKMKTLAEKLTVQGLELAGDIVLGEE